LSEAVFYTRKPKDIVSPIPILQCCFFEVIGLSEEKYVGYVHSGKEYDSELDRLERQASIFEPTTIRHLETMGITEGWKCLEVGAGTGPTARWLSNRVGSKGRVVATDIDMRFLERLNIPNLEVRRHDILKDDLERDEYDLVHCRKLLEHLPDPEKALKKMAHAVRPGGWLLVEEDDYGSMLSVDVTDPSAVSLTAALRRSFDSILKRSPVNPHFGRRLRGLVEGLGFVEVGNEGWTCMTRGGDPLAQLIATDMQLTSRLITIPAGVVTQEEADKYCRLILDPTFYYPCYTFFSAWGRKPIGEGRT